MTNRRSVPFIALLACCVLAGCGRDREQPRDAVAAAQDSALRDTVYTPSEDRVTLPRSRIYYTLTSFPWYAQGRPLLHDGRAYRAQGNPVGASVEEMSKAGEFEGVEYYVHSGDPQPVVYVPVYEGYWQGFRLDPNAPATPDVAAPEPETDSIA